ncbi:hypothetical protein GCM10007424_01400 [Flavobacterium suaedae]|uniref:Uncharacterized protein n=1 Tax=Flavobacterium suaedae TaxID=1767027 RepID=A0ABQ1JCW8_9FLAO|nr:hypothetical protein [Flavobacterium suaedae]GGB65203.1 hypothetical protein GCM10007424_01400 [Flavobacterium suaedae]
MLTEAELLEKNISYIEHYGVLYFDIHEIREAFPNTKFPPDKVRHLALGSFIKDTIPSDDVEEMTDFDLKIKQTLNFNPQK